MSLRTIVTSDGVEHKVHQVVLGDHDDRRKQEWREHWVPHSKGDSGDRLSGYIKGQDILLGGSAARPNGDPRKAILYDSKNEA